MSQRQTGREPALTSNHSRAISRALTSNHSRAIAASVRALTG